MAGGVYDRDPVKVVIINTQYVETDATSFKSVVQRLTGKDSKIGMNPFPSPTSSEGGRNIKKEELMMRQLPMTTGRSNVPVMGRGLSFKDFDRLLKELPPLDELFRLCAD
ncbi:OLC1v1023412C1 [Oldenlandia corymbosa var. corymbosa]|uniref:OLC1v1023412C1 n=1 Tax=Oldenlandia corymbosa var. corymbosa TaxID=529605 RepID=A0AAV1BZY8_OLDCO|nr:OLC1v1023412C1 [Oldenlandia corymbosa var. corymbosa]